MKLSFPEKIIIGACVLGISAITFRAVRLLAVGLTWCGVTVYNGRRFQTDRHRRRTRSRNHADDLQRPAETLLAKMPDNPEINP